MTKQTLDTWRFCSETSVRMEKGTVAYSGDDGKVYSLQSNAVKDFLSKDEGSIIDAEEAISEDYKNAEFAVIYDEDMDGIATTERILFEADGDAQAYFNKAIAEGSKEVILCKILKLHKVN